MKSVFDFIVNLIIGVFRTKKETPMVVPVNPVSSVLVNPAPAIILSTRVNRSKLYPPFAAVVGKFELEAAKIRAYLFDGFRSFDDQMAQYKKGRQLQNGQWIVIEPKLIVTKAQPGMSFHNYGLAVDMVFDSSPVQNVHPNWTWDSKMPWNQLGQIGKSFGLEWAGEWISFPEQPHFQMTYGYKIHQLYDVLTTARTRDQGLLNCWKLFDGASS